ncbi:MULTISPECIES: BglG family transcription antiterminator LicT [Enterococcus]|jgi:beta-glucoside operon transcriptional antiterminator|uniref:PRD domain-containing protein n=1 Tax=Enterococcus dispar ATCC 51266 TaxID=1139219 RepID=S1NDU6_9ENTE|nr:PRD domain-containing protein [Enterococcus dispar]EOT41106.1 hypothetical protein OMK_01275 [Enterococcus dispar ATCC 51266]EOW87260.1 hypothetical protein I569_02631 [Enterococcus dispar ATCC 51266]MCU7356412.1 PRD domain-containing protein [Enterococcus dispar]MDT2704548.1 PRD domain-containing protein [Enterococcus dispar]OJG38743.1 hypothetical protein RV01_GL002189 [Enterococcus dispar]
MQIKKILNNNVIITADKWDNELVVMGKGIAFQKKIGDEVVPGQVDKTYRLSNSNLSTKLQELLEDVPIGYLELATEIIDCSKEKLNASLNDSIYISLTDHLHTAIQRVKNKIRVPNLLLWDIKRFFIAEYSIGKEAVAMIKKRYKVDLGDDEAGFIALHLVNAQTEIDNDNVYEMTELMQEIIRIVSYYFKVQFDEESVYYYRFSTHLRFFASRIMNHRQNEGETDEELLLLIQKKYHNAYSCVEKINQYVVQKYNYHMSNDEKLYLTIHIARLVQKLGQDESGTATENKK